MRDADAAVVREALYTHLYVRDLQNACECTYSNARAL